MSIRAERNTKRTRETEISQLKITITVNQKILRLEITKRDAMAATIPNTLAQLAHELLNHRVAQAKSSQVRTRTIRQSLASATFTNRQSFHVMLQIEVEELENEV